MKTHLYVKIAIITICLTTINIISTSAFSQNKDQSVEVSLKALKLLLDEDYKGFKDLFLQEALGNATDEQFETISIQMKQILDKYDLILAEEIKMDSIDLEGKDLDHVLNLMKISTTKTKIQLNNLIIPILSRTEKDSIKYIKSTVLDKESLIGFNILKGNPFEKTKRRIIETVGKAPHLESFNFDINDLKWFRIWYNNGYKKDRKINNRNYYAVPGGSYQPNTAQLDSMRNTILNNKSLSAEERKKAKNEFDAFYAIMEAGLGDMSNEESIKDTQIRKLLQELFKQINRAKVEIKDYQYLKEEDKGNPEYIYLRFLFNDSKYKNFHELKVRLILQEEPNISEPLSPYIEIKHSEKTRYLLLKDNNKDLVKILKKIAYHDYKDFYEENP